MADLTQIKLKEGDPAPPFTAVTQSREIISLSGLSGRNVVLYFYPKDNTPGCNKEACSFRDAWEDIQKRGAVVLGVSTDSLQSHVKFVEKFKLPFPILVDDQKKIVNAYGVWGPKSFMGFKYTGTTRATFLIGPDGIIKKIWPRVKPRGHAEEVLAAL
jgi:peroxiredoxin Q/BCP